MNALSFNFSQDNTAHFVPRFFFSVASPQGDLPAAHNLQVELEGCAQRTTYGAYFSTIQHALSKENFQIIQDLMKAQGKNGLPEQIHVRAEKHGALYHPASLEFLDSGAAIGKYAALAAVTPWGRESLRRESMALGYLHEAFTLSFLPACLCFVEDDGMSLLIAPWFSGFHEFHVAAGGGFSLWDHDLGLRSIQSDQALQVFFQASRILTLHLDCESGACIHPWSHAAGDFIARIGENGVDVRLTTARGYGPLVETDNPLSALFAFFLDLVLRMRLDREDGVGQWIWLGPDILESAVRGFFAAVDERGAAGDSLQTVVRLLPSFSTGELFQGHEALLGNLSPGEHGLVLPRLEQHCQELAGILRRAADIAN